ncbi:hypothetical protein G7Y89_g2356 [Cudoniella acicularis]|uniref:Uncharacterized protein n=1 Tax=Cudoniella acicularis TaxID=354080 RepID=A0A8H4RUB0_9HELO|nr:hypothetical protein G7Y89_g2356 [Cudoniella acicularis]
MENLSGDVEALAEHIQDPVDKCCFIAGLYSGIYRANDDRDEESSENAIAQLRKAVKLRDEWTSTEIAELFVDICLERLLRRGLKEDADEAESYIRMILKNRPDDYTYLSKLLTILHIRYEMTCSRRYVDESLDLVERVIVDIQDDDDRLPALLAACGVALLDLSELSNSLSALEMAISILRTACGMLSPASTKDWLFARKTLAESLRHHFEATGREEELTQARAIFDDDDSELELLPREALDCLMIRLRIMRTLWQLNPNRESLTRLRKDRLTSAQSTHQGLRVASMVKVLRMMSDLTPQYDSSVDELARLSLGTVLLKAFPIFQASKADVATELGYLAIRFFEKCHDRSFLDRAVAHLRRAVDFSSTNTLSRAFSLQRLTDILKKRGDSAPPEMTMEDFKAAVNTLNTPYGLCKEKNFNFQDSRDSLGDIYASQYNLSHGEGFAIQAIDAWRSLSHSPDGSPIAKLSAALKTAAIQKKLTGDPEKAAEVFTDVIKVLLEVMSDSDSRSEQIWKIRLFSPLSTHAASIALLAARPPEKVLQLLERRRTMIWNRLLARKSDTKTLEDKHHDLAQRFLKLQKLMSRDDDKPDKTSSNELTFQEGIESN